MKANEFMNEAIDESTIDWFNETYPQFEARMTDTGIIEVLADTEYDKEVVWRGHQADFEYFIDSMDDEGDINDGSYGLSAAERNR